MPMVEEDPVPIFCFDVRDPTWADLGGKDIMEAKRYVLDKSKEIDSMMDFTINNNVSPLPDWYKRVFKYPIHKGRDELST